MSSLLLRRCRPAYSTPVIFATLWLYATTTRPSNSSPRLCPGHFTQLTFTVELVFKLLPYLQPGSSSCLSTHRGILCLLLSLQNVVISVHLESPQRGSPSPSLQRFLSRGPRQFHRLVDQAWVETTIRNCFTSETPDHPSHSASSSSTVDPRSSVSCGDLGFILHSFLLLSQKV